MKNEESPEDWRKEELPEEFYRRNSFHPAFFIQG
jgi:hypothetical protein